MLATGLNEVVGPTSLEIEVHFQEEFSAINSFLIIFEDVLRSNDLDSILYLSTQKFTG